MTNLGGRSRRDFLAVSAGSALFALSGRSAASAEVVAKPWGRIEPIGDDVWAVISTPVGSGDWTTGANGGFVAGSKRLIAVDAYVKNEGAAWVAKAAAQLGRRPPTDVVITHYHGDHVGGLSGFVVGDSHPRVWITATTRELVRQDDLKRGRPADPVRERLLDEAEVLDPDQATELDLGGRTVRLCPRGGHTASDVTVELDDPSVVFYGDLYWNGMFPNYMDTTPTPFAKSVRAAHRSQPTSYVGGHGPVADSALVERYLAVIDSIGDAAQVGFAKDQTAAEVAAGYSIPEGLGEWGRFREDYFERAIKAWYEELKGTT